MRYFAHLENNNIKGYYTDVDHGVDNIPHPFVEITEDLWLELTAIGLSKRFVSSEDINLQRVYDQSDFELFEITPAEYLDFPLSEEQIEINNLNAELEMTQEALNEIIMNMKGGVVQ